MSTTEAEVPKASINPVCMDGWLPASTPPTRRGRYAVIYQYASLPPAYFTADWDELEGGWQSLLPPNRVLYWMPYAQMPVAV